MTNPVEISITDEVRIRINELEYIIDDMCDYVYPVHPSTLRARIEELKQRLPLDTPDNHP